MPLSAQVKSSAFVRLQSTNNSLSASLLVVIHCFVFSPIFTEVKKATLLIYQNNMEGKLYKLNYAYIKIKLVPEAVLFGFYVISLC